MTQALFNIQFTRRRFTGWLKKQSPDRAFDYYNVQDCVFASFAKEALKAKKVSCGGNWIVISEKRFALPLWRKPVGNLKTKFTVKDVLEVI